MLKKKKSSDHVEIPLLSKEEREGGSSSTRDGKKTYFTEFLDPNCPPSKYIKNLSILKYLSFFDVLPLIKTANRKKTPLESSDFPLPFSYCNVEKKILDLDEQWSIELGKSHPNFIIALAKAYKKELIAMFLLAWSLVTVKIFSLPLLGNIINGITAKSFGSPVELSDLIKSGLMLAMATVYLTLVVSWYWHAACVMAANMRNTVIGFVYKKLQSVTLSSVQEISVGKVVNLLSNDVNEFDKSGIYFMATLLSPYTITLGAIMMWRFFGFMTIFGILGLMGFLALSNYISKKTQSIRSEKSTITDARIKMTNEFIECIRLIKMYAWEEAFKKAIETLRDREAISLLKLRIMEIFSISVAVTSPQSSLVIMCIFYALAGGMLSPEKIYASLMILNFVSLWAVEFFHHGMMFVSAMKVIKTRLESVLLLKDIVKIEQAGVQSGIRSHNLDRTGPVIFSNFSAWWKSDDARPCLSDINLTLIPGQVTTVIGTIGSGKTSFLLSFLRETPKTQGQLRFEGRVAYVEQEPIIFSGTVQDNILFGREYDEQLYKTVVRACNLHEDFRQFQNGDKTVVGERGITLSGGQKARLSLGRALYSQSDIYLFDDPLSAVDSKVGRHIFNYAIRGQLLKDKVVVLVTHHLNYAKESDRVLLFSEGRIMGDGKFEELRSMDNALFSKFKEIEDEEEKRKSSFRESTIVKPSEKDTKKKEEEIDKGSKLKGEEAEQSVSLKTYLAYVKENDNWRVYFSSIVFCFVFYGGMAIGYIRVLGLWGQEHSTHVYNETPNNEFNNTPFILATICLAMFAILGHTFKSSLVAKFILKTNSTMHSKALHRLSDARILFFDQTPSGTILNRFSNDLGILDSSNATLMPFVFDGCLYIFLRLCTLVILNPALIVPTIIVLYFSFKVRKFLERPVMETKRIDLSSKSPMYSEISATLNGLLAIRVFNQGGNFLKRFCDLLYTNLQAFCYMDRTFKFFAILMSMTLDGLSLVGTFLCIFVAYYTDLDAGLFGLALLMLQEIAQLGNYLIRISLVVDINMQSVTRITNYYNLEPELTTDFRNSSSFKSKSLFSENRNWPHSGEIKFNNVYMKYSPELEFVLKGLSFHIQKGSKIGIVGRTGAGKSSILQALFRMTEYEKIPGSSIEIDGVNISTVEHAILRNSLSIIPQTPVVFTGTIKRNLDPFGQLSDSELWHALQEVNLKDHIEALENKLDTDMTMSSSVFSAGQKQLICLARAILRKSKIIVLDEATANVDIETDDFIQNKIMERFEDCTVITIAHRLLTIANYDRVLVMDKGKAVEYNSPYLLLVEREGDTSLTRKEGIFAEMVRNSGESMSRKIFDIAYKKFREPLNKKFN